MAISIGSADGGEDEIVSAINTTPLVDVMLVLLVIFLITIPVVTKLVPVELPKERNHAQLTKPEDISISVSKAGKIYWNEQAIPDEAALLEKLKQVAVAEVQPAVQIRGDGNSAYEPVGRVVLACQRAGIVKIGFITEPPPRG